MAKVIGFDPKAQKRCTCPDCYAIVEYLVTEVITTDKRDEGVLIQGIKCPNCLSFIRTNH